MSSITVCPTKLNGNVTVPPSKSDVHRAIICAALANGTSTLSPVDMSQDILATIDCVKAMGTQVTVNDSTVIIDGTKTGNVKKADFNCRESGSTLRFIIPIAAALGINSTFNGMGRLPQRPVGIYLDCLPQFGTQCITKGGLPLTIDGNLTSGEYKIPGNISSQFITGLLFALPLLQGDSKITLTTPLESSGYITMTINAMKKFGVTITTTENGYIIKGSQQYTACNYTCEGDWSQAAFFLAGGALGGNITVNGVLAKSPQGDKACADIFKKFGAEVTQTANSVSCKCNALTATDIDARQIPDLVPILAVTAAFANGTTHITGAERLRIKESDRLSAIANLLNSLGAKVTEQADGLTITGVQHITGGNVNGCNDHRIVMSAAISAIKATDNITISDKESINKSYPAFFKDYKDVGGKVK